MPNLFLRTPLLLTITLTFFIGPNRNSFSEDLLPIATEDSKQYVIKPNKEKYLLGEPIFIDAIIKNDRPNKRGWDIDIVDHIIDVKFRPASVNTPHPDSENKNWTDVPLLRYGEEQLDVVKLKFIIVELRSGEKVGKVANGWHVRPEAHSKEPPGEDVDLHTRLKQLNLLFDMSMPGEYRIIYFRTIFYGIDAPLSHKGTTSVWKSNTITIEVADTPFRQDQLKEAFEEGESKTVSDMK